MYIKFMGLQGYGAGSYPEPEDVAGYEQDDDVSLQNSLLIWLFDLILNHLRLTSEPYFSLLFDPEPYFSLLFKKQALLSLLLGCHVVNLNKEHLKHVFYTYFQHKIYKKNVDKKPLTASNSVSFSAS